MLRLSLRLSTGPYFYLCLLEMQHTKLITQHVTGNRARYHVSPGIAHPDKLHLSGWMTTGGVIGTPLVVRVLGVQATSEAYVLSTTVGAATCGSAVIVVSEPDKGHWQHSYPHALGQFQSQKLDYIDVEITDISTGLPVAFSPTAVGATNTVVLEFTISHRDKRFNTNTLTTYKSDMYDALN
jgi:hypothetical protein